ncbi:hypothetical protein, partial [Bradyrhizobium stylosanthis]|uniref:hypothetical protein n=1 Tax=Bradyrhizobium stylosanthis TaxID=1803665 RepID=UPI001AEE17F3
AVIAVPRSGSPSCECLRRATHYIYACFREGSQPKAETRSGSVHESPVRRLPHAEKAFFVEARFVKPQHKVSSKTEHDLSSRKAFLSGGSLISMPLLAIASASASLNPMIEYKA